MIPAAPRYHHQRCPLRSSLSSANRTRPKLNWFADVSGVSLGVDTGFGSRINFGRGVGGAGFYPHGFDARGVKSIEEKRGEQGQQNRKPDVGKAGGDDGGSPVDACPGECAGDFGVHAAEHETAVVIGEDFEDFLGHVGFEQGESDRFDGWVGVDDVALHDEGEHRDEGEEINDVAEAAR